MKLIMGILLVQSQQGKLKRWVAGLFASLAGSRESVGVGFSVPCDSPDAATRDSPGGVRSPGAAELWSSLERENLAEMHSPEKLDGDYSATADSNVSAELETSISPNGDLQEGNDGENKNIGNSNALANGLSSMLINIIRDFDSKADDTLKSQSQLSSSLDRLTTELDQLLEDAPFPFIMQHASRISNVRKRVLSLNSILRTIQRRVDNIDRAISMGNLPDTRSSQNSSHG
ncbi:unnamed protein product [Citrullus colocynthis]|uniref:Biogenesis of lysosome-related organelles complex 1 subunit 7 n=1 Tax=Citrullus colocynthis TaxID=252529 RepID=A0ABP0Z235_9ROSI